VDQNSQFTLTATVSGTQSPTGTVTFYIFGNPVTGEVPMVGGQAQYTVIAGWWTPGITSVTARYNGDTKNLISTSAALSQVITGTTTVNIQANTGGDFHSYSAVIGVQ